MNYKNLTNSSILQCPARFGDATIVQLSSEDFDSLLTYPDDVQSSLDNYEIDCENNQASSDQSDFVRASLKDDKIVSGTNYSNCYWIPVNEGRGKHTIQRGIVPGLENIAHVRESWSNGGNYTNDSRTNNFFALCDSNGNLVDETGNVTLISLQSA